MPGRRTRLLTGGPRAIGELGAERHPHDGTGLGRAPSGLGVQVLHRSRCAARPAKVLHATDGHRVPAPSRAKKASNADQPLKAGGRLASPSRSRVRLGIVASPYGIAAGDHFGRRSSREQGSFANLVHREGHEDCSVVPASDSLPARRSHHHQDCRPLQRELPSLEENPRTCTDGSPHFAADGCVADTVTRSCRCDPATSNTSATVHTPGHGTYEVPPQERIGIDGRPSLIHHVGDDSVCPAEFFLLSAHRMRFRATRRRTCDGGWCRVGSKDEPGGARLLCGGRGTHSFVLETHPHWKLLRGGAGATSSGSSNESSTWFQ